MTTAPGAHAGGKRTGSAKCSRFAAESSGFEATLRSAVRSTCLCFLVASILGVARSASAQPTAGTTPSTSGEVRLNDPEIIAPAVLQAEISSPPDVREPVDIVLELLINPAGEVTSARAIKGPETLRKYTESAAFQFRFTPALHHGKPVASKIHFLVHLEPVLAEEVTPRETEPSPAMPPAAKAPRQKAHVQEVEVTVTGQRNVQVSTRITRFEAREIPGTFGDPLRAVESNPGVTPIYTGVPFFFIRGAPPGNVGYYVDGIRIPLLYHALLGPSVIHPGLIDHVDIYRGAAPARFGGNAGATVSAESRGPLARAGGEGNLRVFDVGGLVEQPLANGRLHVMAGGRYSYTALIASLLSGATLEYWDYQGRISYDLDRANRLTITSFGAFDKFESGNSENLYGGGLQFHRIDLREDYTGTRTRARIAATFGSDRTSTSEGFIKTPSFNSRSYFEYQASRELTLNAGHEAQVADYSLKVPSTVSGFDVLRALFPTRRDLTAGVFAEVAWTPIPLLTLTPGVRADSFRSGPYTKSSADARFAAVFAPTRYLKAIQSIGTSHQPPGFVPQIPGAQIGTLKGGLQRSIQASSALSLDVATQFTATVTAFEARYSNLVDPVSQYRTFDLTTIDPDALVNNRSQGRSYGIEVEIRRPMTHRLGGFIAYTFSRSERVDAGHSSLSGYDRPHVFQAALGYDLGRNWRAGARLMAYTGLPARQQLRDESYVYIYDGERRAPSFYRLDARLEKRWPFSAKGYWAVVFEMLNATLSQEVTALTCSAQRRCFSETSGPVSIPSVGLEVYAY